MLFRIFYPTSNHNFQSNTCTKKSERGVRGRNGNGQKYNKKSGLAGRCHVTQSKRSHGTNWVSRCFSSSTSRPMETDQEGL